MEFDEPSEPLFTSSSEQPIVATQERAPLARRLMVELNWPSFLAPLFFLTLAHFAIPINLSAWTLTSTNEHIYEFPEANPQHVPNWGLPVFFLMTGGLIVIVEMTVVSGTRKRWRAANMFLALGEAILWTTAITEAGKRWVAEPRPDFLAHCRNVTVSDSGLVDCVGDKATLLEERLSFPSGHSSLSMCTGVFGSAYLLWVVYWRIPHSSALTLGRRQLFRLLFGVCLSPLITGMAITASRVVDHRHSPADVTAGALLGSLVAILFCIRVIYDMYPAQPTHSHTGVRLNSLEFL